VSLGFDRGRLRVRNDLADEAPPEHGGEAASEARSNGRVLEAVAK
jgi:hypothetical protein